MKIEEVKALIEQDLVPSYLTVEGDGRHFNIVIVSTLFVRKSRVQRQQLVYRCLNVAIATGDLHAVTMKTLTPEEWTQENG